MVRKLMAMVVLSLSAASCHTITEELPTQPKTPTTAAPAPIPVIVVPVPAVTPTPTPAATPTPAPAPGTPTPAPAPPSGQACSLGRGNGSGSDCPLERARFQEVVERAIDNVIRNNPSLFDKSKDRCVQGCPFVRDTDGYWDAVTDEVRRLGYCATNDGEELAVKNSNSFNDQYDIINSEGFVRRGTGSYRATCYPAWF
ncbi:MAG TPA: hypothetical protein VIK51_04665 [Vicinamibacteria bacterium]